MHACKDLPVQHSIVVGALCGWGSRGRPRAGRPGAADEEGAGRAKHAADKRQVQVLPRGDVRHLDMPNLGERSRILVKTSLYPYHPITNMPPAGHALPSGHVWVDLHMMMSQAATAELLCLRDTEHEVDWQPVSNNLLWCM